MYFSKRKSANKPPGIGTNVRCVRASKRAMHFSMNIYGLQMLNSPIFPTISICQWKQIPCLFIQILQFARVKFYPANELNPKNVNSRFTQRLIFPHASKYVTFTWHGEGFLSQRNISNRIIEQVYCSFECKCVKGKKNVRSVDKFSLLYDTQSAFCTAIVLVSLDSGSCYK